MSDVHIRPYEEGDREHLQEFKLSERQRLYTNLPIDVLDDAIQDPDRMPCVVTNEAGEVVGFFVCHKHYQYEGFDTPHEVVYVRTLSINEELQGRGYGTKVVMSIPLFIQERYASFDHLFLVVDAENEAALSLYERAGFIHTATKEDGAVGPERLYYLDLDLDYVHNIKLKRDDAVGVPHIKIDIILNQRRSIGYIEGEMDGGVMRISHLQVDGNERNRGVASSALRQLGPFLRREVPEIRMLTVYPEDTKGKERLFERVGFVKLEEQSTKHFMKYIKY